MSTTSSSPKFDEYTSPKLVEKLHSVADDVASTQSAQPVLDLLELMGQNIRDLEVGRLMFSEEFTQAVIDLISPYDAKGMSLVRAALYQCVALHNVNFERDSSGSYGQQFSTYDDLSEVPFELETQEDLFIEALFEKTPEQIAHSLSQAVNYVSVLHTFQEIFPDKIIPALIKLDHPAVWPIIENAVFRQGAAGLNITADIKRQIDSGDIASISNDNVKALAERIYTEEFSDVSKLLSSLERKDAAVTIDLSASFQAAHDEGLINPDIMVVLDKIVAETSTRRAENKRRGAVVTDIQAHIPQTE